MAGIVRIAAGRTPALEIKTSELDFVPAPEEPWVEAQPTEQRYAVSEPALVVCLTPQNV